MLDNSNMLISTRCPAICFAGPSRTHAWRDFAHAQRHSGRAAQSSLVQGTPSQQFSSQSPAQSHTPVQSSVHSSLKVQASTTRPAARITRKLGFGLGAQLKSCTLIAPALPAEVPVPFWALKGVVASRCTGGMWPFRWFAPPLPCAGFGQWPAIFLSGTYIQPEQSCTLGHL